MKQQDAVQIFLSAVAGVQPEKLLQQYITINGDTVIINGHNFHSGNKIYITGAGKATAAMAAAIEKILGNKIAAGIITTKYGHSVPLNHIQIIEAAHPVPDENGILAVNKTLGILQQITKDDLLICLFSGGASALWCDLPQEISLDDMQTTADILIKSGAPIHEINTVRKHVSTIKGGQLIPYCNGATVVTFIISDVPFDNPGIIASAPTVPDPSTFQDAYDIINKYHLLSVLPKCICLHLQKGINGQVKETPKPGDILFKNVFSKIIGNNQLALACAAIKAKELGYHVHISPHVITGDAESEAKKFAAIIPAYQGKKPLCFLQGGETTVQVTGSGKGGRNQHFALAVWCELQKHTEKNVLKNITILSAGTDGTDGPTDAAGAILDDTIINVAVQNKLDPLFYLSNHNAYHFFQQVDGLLITGPTQTNVMDIMIALIY